MKFVILLLALLFPFGTGQVLANNPCCQPIVVTGKKEPTQVNDPGYYDNPYDPYDPGVTAGGKSPSPDQLAKDLQHIKNANDAVEGVCKRSGESPESWLTRAIAAATAANLGQPAILSVIRDIAATNAALSSFPALGGATFASGQAGVSRGTINPQDC